MSIHMNSKITLLPSRQLPDMTWKMYRGAEHLHASLRITMLLVRNHKLFGCMREVKCHAGVCVLAATSRPDLLDAALLRPGRLDRLIYCGFPSTLERGQILHALARRLRLDAAVDLDAVGVQCEGYSGADLSALLSEAQLAAVHACLDLAG